MSSISRRECVAATLAVAAAAPAARAAAPDGLDAAAHSRGMRFGTAINARQVGDPRYTAVTLADCSLLVPENELKWYVVRPDPKTFDFRGGDRIADFARKNRLEIRGHTLLWHHVRWFPGWAVTYDYGSRPAVEAERLIVEYVRKMAGRYSDVIKSWDVVNETVDAGTGQPRETPFTKAMGGDRLAPVDLAFRTARDAAPNAELVYNDYMGWEAGNEAHRAGVLRLLEGFRKRGVPVDALGIQSHIGTDNNEPSKGFDTRQEREWRRFLDEVTGMGYRLLITEFDVHDAALPADVRTRDAAVAAYARDYLDVTLSYRQLRDVLAWGLVDKDSWLQGRWKRPDGLPKRPCPYDADYRRKPLHAAMAAAFRAAPAR